MIDVIKGVCMFNRSGNELTLVDESSTTVESPDPGVWYFKVNETTGIKLVKDTEFKYDFPKKVYGGVEKMGDAIINRWVSHTKNTGVLLSGSQGTGKSLQSQYIISKGIKTFKAVVVVITKPLVAKEIFQYIQNIKGPVIIYIDEFEKVYNWDDQEKLLSFMDGFGLSGILWLLTANNLSRVGMYYLDRPSRLFYHIRYGNVSMDIVDNIVKERLKNKSLVKETVKAISGFNKRTYDIILSFIEEINFTKGKPDEIVPYMNIELNNFSKDTQRIYYRLFVKNDKGDIEDITNYYDSRNLERFARDFDIFGDRGKGRNIREWTELTINASTSAYQQLRNIKLDSDTYVDIDNPSVARFKVGKALGDRDIYLEFGKEPYPEPPPIKEEPKPTIPPMANRGSNILHMKQSAA